MTQAPWKVRRYTITPQRPTRDLLILVAVAAAIGAITGILAASFLVALGALDDGRGGIIGWAHDHGVAGFIALVALGALCVSLSVALVHRIEPHAEGSGISRMGAVVQGRVGLSGPWVLPVKYVAGLLAIGSGLALGREGPSVQMGGSVAGFLGQWTKRNQADIRLLVGAGAAAGMATAFNAPIAGGVFALEQLLRRFDHRSTLATLTASGAGFSTARLVMGERGPDLHAPALPLPQLHYVPFVVVVGLLAGLLGVAYNRLTMQSLHIADRMRFPRELRGLIVGALVAVLAYFYPHIVGGGDNITQKALDGGYVLGAACLYFVVRLVLGIVSYAVGTPGGLIAPMLALGALVGAAISNISHAIVPQWSPPVATLVLVAIVAVFTGAIQTPITGLVLITEMTGAVNQLPPMLGGCAVALLVAMAFKSVPLFDALSARAATAGRANIEEGERAAKAHPTRA